MDNGIIGIIRTDSPENIVSAIEAALRGGLKTIEITMNTPDAARYISDASKEFGKEICLGAGTVRTPQELIEAASSGAKYIVSPNIREELAMLCKQYNLGYYPGALTPTEIENAWKLGATKVKVFPVSAMGGVKYIKDIRGPFKDIKLLACGGVKPDNIKDYFDAGINAVAIGSQIFNNDWIVNKDLKKIEESASRFVKIINGL